MGITNILPVIFLFLVAPFTELGNTPPEVFFNPIVFLIFSAMYGGGALLMRELRTRWGKGLASLLLLGAAYGLIEEGLIGKSIFNPDIKALGIYSEFGRLMGVNWIIGEMMLIGHAIVSITIPVLLVEIIFPKNKNEPWTGKIGFLALLVLFASVWLFFGSIISENVFLEYDISIMGYILMISAIIFFVFLARIAPSGLGGHGSARGHMITFFILGAVWYLIFGHLFSTLWYFVQSPVIVFSAVLVWVFIFSIILAHYDWSNNRHRLALILGIYFSLLFNTFIFPLILG